MTLTATKMRVYRGVELPYKPFQVNNVEFDEVRQPGGKFTRSTFLNPHWTLEDNFYIGAENTGNLTTGVNALSTVYNGLTSGFNSGYQGYFGLRTVQISTPVAGNPEYWSIGWQSNFLANNSNTVYTERSTNTRCSISISYSLTNDLDDDFYGGEPIIQAYAIPLEDPNNLYLGDDIRNTYGTLYNGTPFQLLNQSVLGAEEVWYADGSTGVYSPNCFPAGEYSSDITEVFLPEHEASWPDKIYWGIFIAAATRLTRVQWFCSGPCGLAPAPGDLVTVSGNVRASSVVISKLWRPASQC